MTKYKNALARAARTGAAVSDPHRLRMLMALREGELCVCQLTALTGLAASTVSKHLSILRDAGLVESRKAGRWVYCRLAEQTDFPILGNRAPEVFQALEKSPQVRADDRARRKIAKEPMDDLCRRLATRGKP